MYYIYRITNKINGKTYIGQHKYKELNDSYMGSGVHLRRAQKKYGMKNFEKKILVFNISKKEYADLLEETFISAEREKVGIENCYNKADGGQGNRGHHITEETRQKLSESHKGKPGYWRGKHFSEAHLNKLSESHKGKPSNRRGVHLSDETKRKISEVQKGKKLSEETKRKLSGWHWYNNGEISIQAKECPEGFVKGRICKLVDGKKVYL